MMVTGYVVSQDGIRPHTAAEKQFFKEYAARMKNMESGDGRE